MVSQFGPEGGSILEHPRNDRHVDRKKRTAVGHHAHILNAVTAARQHDLREVPDTVVSGQLAAAQIALCVHDQSCGDPVHGHEIKPADAKRQLADDVIGYVGPFVGVVPAKAAINCI